MTRAEDASRGPFSSALPATLVEVLRHHAVRRPQQLAFTFLRDGEIPDSRCTFAELDSRVRATAALLQRLPGCRAGARALLLLPTGIDYIVGFFACQYAGLVAVPCYPPRRERLQARLLAIIADADVALILSTSEILGSLRDGVRLPAEQPVELVALDTLHQDAPPDWQQPSLSGDSLAFLQYTSGSTGTPKGVMVSHGNLIHNAEQQKRAFAHDEQTVYVNWPPLFHDMGLIGNVIQSVYIGVHCVLMTPAAFAQKPYRWLKAISDYRATTSGGPNFAYDLCVRKITDEQLRTLDLSTWTVAYNGAEPIRSATLEAFSRRFSVCGFRRESFHSCYGMAETTLLVSSGPRGRFPRVFLAQPEALKQDRAVPATDPAHAISIVSCGRPWPGVDLRIVDPHSFRACAEGELGEVWVASKDVTKGYWNRPDATREAFAAHLAATGEGPFLRTGDLGFLYEGELYFAGRHKDLIIICGQNYHPSDLELTTGLCHPALHSGHGAAFSIEVDGEERLVIAHEVLRAAQESVEVALVAAAMRQAIAEHHGLALEALALLQPGTLPRTSSGKIQRRQCRQLFLAGKLSTVGTWRRIAAAPGETAAPASPARSSAAAHDTLTWLRGRLAAMLQLEAGAIDIEQPFSAYGLDSTSAAGLSGELAERLGRRLGATLLYDYPSIATLVAHLHPAGDAVAVPGAASPLPFDEPIAVVGMSCRFPQASDPTALWQLLERGGDAIRPLPPLRRHLCGFPDELSPWGGFLDDIEQFDADCFGIAPREAAAMDPQQRLLLEVAWAALEDAGLPPAALRGSRTGVFIGICSNDYLRLQTAAGRPPDAWSGTGNALSIAANRLSYVFDLRGPSKAVDTACSSSLVAIHDACRSLLAGDCQVALAGGVHLCLAPDLFLSFDAARMLAKGGRCRTFDAGAEGYVRGEGCGVLVLKRLSAVGAQERVLALIKGSAVNQDGRSNGLTAPNGPAQQDVMDQALRAARIAPAAVGHIEAHGTGTPLGDPIEMTALHAVYGAGAAPCFVGSVKTNIGHLEAAAGVAGVIKSILLLTHRTIPRHLHFTRLHPAIPLESSRLRIATETTPWPETAPHAAVSSFGFGGTNAHLVLAPPPPIAGPSRRTPAHRPLQRQRYWFERPAEPHPRHAAARPYIHPLLGMPLWTANSKPGEHLFAVELSAREPAFLGEHRLFATPLLPAAAYLESALAAARHAGGNGPFAAGQARAPLLLSAVRIEQPLVLPEAAPQQVQLLLTAEPPASPSDWSFQILRLADSDAAPRFRLHAAGRVGFASTAADASGPAALSLAALRARCTQPVPVAECYLRYRQLGLAYGPAFAALTELWRGEQEVLARLQLPAAAAPPGADAYALHPVLLDAGFQALGVLVPAPAEGDRCVVPVGLDRLQLWRTAQQPVWATGQLHEAGSAPGRYRGDVQLLAEDGQVLCRVEGLLLQSVSRDELLGSDSASAAADAGGGAIDPGLPPPRAEPEAAGRRHIAGLSTEPAQRQALDALLADELRRALCLPASAMIAPDRGFFDMGLDSLMATEIRNRLQRQLGIVLPPTVMFKFATPEELSEHLLQHLSLTPELAIAPPPAATPPPAAAPPPAPPAPDPAAGDAYERVLQLSEDALTALIDAKLKRFSE